MTHAETRTRLEGALDVLTTGDLTRLGERLDAFFDGKSKEAIRAGLRVLLKSALSGRGTSSLAARLVDYVTGASVGAEFRLPPNDPVFMGLLREACEISCGSGSRKRVEAFERLKELFRATVEQVDASAWTEIVSERVRCVETPYVWVDFVATFCADELSRHGLTPEQVRLSDTGNPALEVFYREECLRAAAVAHEAREYGFAAVYLTLAGSEDASRAYDLAHTNKAYVPLDLVHLREEDPCATPFTFRSRTSETMIKRRLFGDAADQEGFVLPLLPEGIRFTCEYVLTPEGDVRLSNDPISQRIAEVYLSHGCWQEAVLALSLLSPPPDSVNYGARRRRLSNILLPAMCVAEREGRLAVAAALGQALLVRHAQVGRIGRNQMLVPDAWGLVHAAEGLSRSSALGVRYAEVKAKIWDFEHPESCPDLWNGASAPYELKEEEKALSAQVRASIAPFVETFIARIDRLFDGVIKRGERLDLQVL